MSKYKTGEDFYNRIYFRFNALIAISLIPFGILLLDIHTKPEAIPTLNGAFAYIISILVTTISGYTTYHAFDKYKTQFGTISRKMDLRSKLDAYYEYNMEKYVRISIACCALVTILFITRIRLIIPAYVIVLILLSIGRPTLRDMIRELGLNSEEEGILYRKDHIS